MRKLFAVLVVLAATFAVGQEVGQEKPRVFLQAQSFGNTANAGRDQSMEMSKDLERLCPGVKVTIFQQKADYTLILNHIELGMLVRDNQFQIANADGDLITTTKEGGSIAGGVKGACALIMNDWARQHGRPNVEQKSTELIPAGFFADPNINLSPDGYSALQKYPKWKIHKAFAVSPDGHYGFGEGYKTQELATSNAIGFCERGTRTCRLILVDDQIVK